MKSSNVRKLLAKVSYKILGKGPKKLIAVTGTNGKSSVADFYYQIMNLNLKKAASIGTIGIRYKDKKKILTKTISVQTVESEIAKSLTKVQNKFADVNIGS